MRTVPSTTTVFEGRLARMESLKEKSLGTVRVETDDTLIDLGVLLRDSKHEIRVGFVGTRVGDNHHLGRQTTQIVVIPRNRIRKLERR